MLRNQQMGFTSNNPFSLLSTYNLIFCLQKRSQFPSKISFLLLQICLFTSSFLFHSFSTLCSHASQAHLFPLPWVLAPWLPSLKCSPLLVPCLSLICLLDQNIFSSILFDYQYDSSMIRSLSHYLLNSIAFPHGLKKPLLPYTKLPSVYGMPLSHPIDLYFHFNINHSFKLLYFSVYFETFLLFKNFLSYSCTPFILIISIFSSPNFLNKIPFKFYLGLCWIYRLVQ